MPRERPVSLRAIASLALWLGVCGFGGGFAVAQRIRHSVVQERRWMSEADFFEHFAVAGALPGTAATNLLTMLGSRFAGARGGAACAVAFLLPSVVLMIAFGVIYDRLRGVGAVASFLDGMGYATVGVVAAVALDMRRHAVRTVSQFVIAGLAVLTLSLGALSLLEAVGLAGFVGVLALRPPTPPPSALEVRDAKDDVFPPASTRLSSVALPMLAMLGASSALVVVFARIGVATFGGGFAMIPSIEHEVVAVHGWLSEAAFHDAMVIGQVTPGPVAIAATFIGYRVGGIVGSVAATVGMFGPPFVLSLLAARSLTAFRSNVFVRGFLCGVSPAVVGVIAAAAVSLARTTLASKFALGVALATFALLGKFPKLSPLLPLAVGGAMTTLVGV
jgi:chromate transporter